MPYHFTFHFGFVHPLQDVAFHCLLSVAFLFQVVPSFLAMSSCHLRDPPQHKLKGPCPVSSRVPYQAHCKLREPFQSTPDYHTRHRINCPISSSVPYPAHYKLWEPIQSSPGYHTRQSINLGTSSDQFQATIHTIVQT